MIIAITLPYAPPGYISRLFSSLFKSASRYPPMLLSGIKLGPGKGYS
jgi:hypothetical protein